MSEKKPVKANPEQPNIVQEMDQRSAGGQQTAQSQDHPSAKPQKAGATSASGEAHPVPNAEGLTRHARQASQRTTHANQSTKSEQKQQKPEH